MIKPSKKTNRNWKENWQILRTQISRKTEVLTAVTTTQPNKK
jgi:hypothetical protein